MASAPSLQPNVPRATSASLPPNTNVTVYVRVASNAPTQLVGTVYPRSSWLSRRRPVAQFTIALTGCGRVAMGVMTCSKKFYLPPARRYAIVLHTDRHGTPIGKGFVARTIRPNVTTPIALTTGNRLAGIQVVTERTAIPAIDSARFGAIVTGRDARGSAIVASSFGTARIALSLRAGAGAMTLSASSIAKPGSGLIAVSYDSSKASDSQIQSGFGVRIDAAAGAGNLPGTPAKIRVRAPRFTETSIPTSGSLPEAIAAGPDGRMWFCEFGTGKVGVAQTRPLRVVAEYSTQYDNPYNIAAGPDGAMWVSNWNASGGITRITTQGAVTPYALPVNTYPAAIANGPGGKLWFGSVNLNYVSWIATSGALGPQYALPAGNNYPLHSTLGPDDNQYFSLEGSGEIAQVTSIGVIAHLYAIPGTQPSPEDIVAAPDGKLYLVDNHQNAVFAMTTSGTFSRWKVPSGDSAASGPLAVGPDGKIWFVTSSGIARLNPNTGSIFLVPFPVAGSGGAGLALGPDGALYATESATNQIARMQ